MPLPETIRAKLSSEAADTISVTPVVARDMPMRELIEMMLGVTGKDALRIRELLRRGSLVSGASRFRWNGWESAPADVEAMLATFPDPDPRLPFRVERCVRAVLRGPAVKLDLPRAVASERRFLRRRSFWDAIAEAIRAAPIDYVEYSYRERADVYRAILPIDAVVRIRDSAGLIKYTTLERQIRSAHVDSADLYVERDVQRG